MNYEYRYVAGVGDPMRELNLLGADRWEVVTFWKQPDSMYGWAALMKRELVNGA